MELKEFKMFSHAIVSMSLVHMLAVDLHASVGNSFPTGVITEVDDEEVEVNFNTALQRHDTMYKDKAKNIKETHDA